MYRYPVLIRVDKTLREFTFDTAAQVGVSVNRLVGKALTVYLTEHFGYIEPPPEPEKDPLP